MSIEILCQGIPATYRYYVEPLLETCPKVTLTQSRVEEIKQAVQEIIPRKLKELEYIHDPNKLSKRYLTGWGGESAVEAHIGKHFVDFSVGHSKDYSYPDLLEAGYPVGVKTVTLGDFPLIMSPRRGLNDPQIIVVKETDLDYYICGLAGSEAINEPSYFDRRFLVKDRRVREKGRKEAFFRFDQLTPLGRARRESLH